MFAIDVLFGRPCHLTLSNVTAFFSLQSTIYLSRSVHKNTSTAAGNTWHLVTADEVTR